MRVRSPVVAAFVAAAALLALTMSSSAAARTATRAVAPATSPSTGDACWAVPSTAAAALLLAYADVNTGENVFLALR